MNPIFASCFPSKQLFLEKNLNIYNLFCFFHYIFLTFPLQESHMLHFPVYTYLLPGNTSSLLSCFTFLSAGNTFCLKITFSKKRLFFFFYGGWLYIIFKKKILLKYEM